ncbi:MAG: hypothetical protein ACREMY_06530, partial [bacterium]
MMEAIEISCSICGKPIPTERGLKLHLIWHTKRAEAAEIPDDGPYDESPETDEIRPVSLYDEMPPVEPVKSGWREKMWGSTAPKSKPSVTVGPKPRKRRTSTEGVWMTVWMAAGVGLVRSGADVPVGNVLQFQAPIVGEILDEAIAG